MRKAAFRGKTEELWDAASRVNSKRSGEATGTDVSAVATSSMVVKNADQSPARSKEVRVAAAVG